ncbi:MAG: hypothetical protein NTY69_02930 [Methylococcales bacterium]|nr:hypothetical protein [Methylococcales bacterium]
MIIKISLAFLAIAFTLFVSADLLSELNLTKFSQLTTHIGVICLFAAFLILLVSGLFLILSYIKNNLATYFSSHERIQRRLLFISAKQTQLQQLFFFKSQKINYSHGINKKRLLKANNKKQIKELLALTNRDLHKLKNHLPKADYLYLKQTSRQFYNDDNLVALLELQQTISTHSSLK